VFISQPAYLQPDNLLNIQTLYYVSFSLNNTKKYSA